MNNILIKLRTNLEQKKGERNQLLQSIKDQRGKIRKLTKSIGYDERARLIIQTEAQKTQNKLTVQISDVVTSALSSVFEDPYEFKLDFKTARGKTEAYSRYLRNEYELNPMDGSGLGAVVVGALAQRVGLFTIRRKIDPGNIRSTLILDEPFLRLKGSDYPERAGKLLKEISRKLGIQIICVSHTDEITDSADKVFEVRKKREGKWLVSNLV